jgi:hypothetical protein
MILLSRKITWWTDCEMDGGMITARVLFPPWARITNDLETRLFDIARLNQPHFGGPGHSFISTPTYHTRYGMIAVIHQHFGMDI